MIRDKARVWMGGIILVLTKGKPTTKKFLGQRLRPQHNGTEEEGAQTTGSTGDWPGVLTGRIRSSRREKLERGELGGG